MTEITVPPEEAKEKVRASYGTIRDKVEIDPESLQKNSDAAFLRIACEFRSKPIIQGHDIEPPADCLESLSNKLAQFGIAALKCWDYELARNTASAMRTEPGQEDVIWRLLPADALRDVPEPALSFDALVRGDADGDKLIFVALLYDDSAELQIRQLLTTLSDPADLGHRLKERGRGLLLLLPPVTLVEESAAWSQVSVAADYLEPLWNCYVLQTGPAIAPLLKMLREQLEKGIWGKDHGSIYETIKSFYRERTLDRRIAEIDEAPDERTVLLDGEQGQRLIRLIDNGIEPECTILFIATFFGRLSARDFDALIIRMLGERGASSFEDIEVALEDGGRKIVRQTIVRRYVEDYLKASNKYLTSLGLIPLINDSGIPVIDFNRRFMTQEMGQFFARRGILIFNRYYDEACQAKLLFHPSRELALKFMDLATQAARLDNPHHAERWLTELLWVTMRDINTGIDAGHAVSDAIDFDQLVLSLRKSKDEDWERFCGLLHRFCGDAQLANFVGRLIKQRIEKSQYTIALALLEGIGYHANFNVLPWIRHIMEAAGGRDRLQAAGFMRSFVLQSGRWMVEYLEQVVGWLPEDRRSWEDYSTAQKMVCRELAQMLLDLSRQSDEEEYGEKFDHPLVRGCCSKGMQARGTMVKILSHPGIHSYLEKYAVNEEHLLSDVVEQDQIGSVYYEFLVRSMHLAGRGCRRESDEIAYRKWMERMLLFGLLNNSGDSLLSSLGRFLSLHIVHNVTDLSPLVGDVNRFARCLIPWIVGELYVVVHGLSETPVESIERKEFSLFLTDFLAFLSATQRKRLTEGLSELADLLSALGEAEIVHKGNSMTKLSKQLLLKAKAITRLQQTAVKLGA